MVDFSFGLDTWKMLFSPKLNTGTSGDPVCTAILTNPCTDFSMVVSCTMCSPYQYVQKRTAGRSRMQEGAFRVWSVSLSWT